ncbi:MAG: DUF3943 domain-containing protein [Bacteroidales bacterium]
MLTRLLAALIILFPTSLLAQEDVKDSLDYDVQSMTLSKIGKDWSLYSDHTSPFENRCPNRLLKSSGIIIGASVVSFGLLYLMPESFTNWDKDEMTFATITNDWKENVKAGPVIDKDDLFLNWIMHPYFGGIYYMTARSAGHKWYTSAIYSAIVSTFFWEYGIEAFAEVPSLQDLIITPVLGSMVGEAFFRAKKSIKRNNYYLLGSQGIGKCALFLMDPLNEIQDGFVRRRIRRTTKTNNTQLHSYLNLDPLTGTPVMNISLVF